MRLYIILLFCVLCGCTTKTSGTNYFSTEESNKWLQHAMYPFVSIERGERDSTGVVMHTRGKEKGVLGRIFENPRSNNTPVDVRVMYQAGDCSSLSIVAYCFSSDGGFLGSDTLMLPQISEWTEFNGKIDTRNCESFTLTVEAQGMSDKFPGWVSIRKLSLSAKGKPLPETKEREVRPIKETDVLDWEDLLSSPLMDKRILALGETVHGTETLGNMAFALMKERVLHHNCKLLLIELPVEFTLTLNRYVKNDRRFEQSYTDICHRLRGSLFTDSIIPFVEWVKEYNATHNNEVSLYGVDFNPLHLDSEVDLSYFLYVMNGKRMPVTDSLCRMMLKNDSKADEILRQLEANKTLTQEMTEAEFFLLRNSLSYWDVRSTYIRYGMRDEVMASTTQKLVTFCDSLRTTTTMYTHFGHAGYHSVGLGDKSRAIFPDIRSMGQQLKTYYADDYACLTLTCSHGNATIGEQNTLKTKALKACPESSIEYQMSKKGKSISFLPVGNLSAGISYHIRHLGNRYSENQFFLLTPQSWMEGIVLAEEAEACKKDKKNAQRPLFLTMERLEQLLKKINFR